MEAGVQEKLKHLKDLLAGYDGLAVAFSGGVDSTFLLMCAREVLGPRVLALTINGPHISPAEFMEAKRFCEAHDISQLVINMPDDLFDAIAGERESEGIPKKPAPDGVWGIMKELKVTAAEAVYIGDSEVDVATARNAGLDGIFVTWGFRSPEQIRAAGGTTIVDTTAEVKALILA
jgi:3'-phosphoadenosine 5'-phosphosulfate sulfotransferase (PAPS reductase)/FAD synthetase